MAGSGYEVGLFMWNAFSQVLETTISLPMKTTPFFIITMYIFANFNSFCKEDFT